MKKILIKSNKNSAFTLIELLLVVGIIAIGSIVAYYVYNKVLPAQKAQAELQSLNTIRSSLETQWNKAGYVNLDSDYAIATNIVPQKMITASNTLVNEFGGDVHLGWYNGLDTTVNTIGYIWSYSVPTEACVSIVSKAYSSWHGIMIHPSWGALGSWPDYSPTCARTVPKNGDLAAITNMCTGGDRDTPGTSSTVTMIYLLSQNPANRAAFCADGS